MFQFIQGQIPYNTVVNKGVDFGAKLPGLNSTVSLSEWP